MRILFFAQLKDLAGRQEVEWSDVASLSAGDFWERLLRQFPTLAPHRAFTRLACNGRFVTSEAVFQSGDEIALIPPVSGG
jgi:molybdopterin converting factor subunit 1